MADHGGWQESASTRITALLGESLRGSIPVGTERRVGGRASFPGKATAVVGMRRAGKTTFLHQIGRQRLDAGIARERLPYINFEDERLAEFRLQDFPPSSRSTTGASRRFADRRR